MKKGKRLLSAILAVLLIVGMIPVAASADGEGVPTATISVGTLPSWWNDDVAIDVSGDVLSALLDYGKFQELPRDYTLEQMQAKAAEINAFYTPIAGKGDSEENPYQVNKGDTFYLALDMSYAPADKGGYNHGQQYAIETPRDVFKLADGDSTLTNPMLNSVEWMNRNARTQYVAGAENYHPGQTPFDLEVVYTEETKDKDGNETSRYKFSFDGGSGIIPNAATWDGIIVLEATGDTGIYKVEVATDNMDTNSYLDELGASGAISSLVTTQKGWQKTAGSNAFNATDSEDNEGLDQSAIQTKPIYIEIINPSVEPDGTYGEGSIINNKNLPYISEDEANNHAENHADYLIFPEDEHVFQLGDDVVIFKTGETEGTYGDALGYTEINKNTLVLIDGDSIIDYPTEIPEGTKLSDLIEENDGKLALRLVETEEDIGDTDGSYVKNEGQVYIARVDKQDPDDIKDRSNPDDKLLVKVDIETVNGEKVAYYSDDIPAIPEGYPGSSRANPFEITLGTSVSDLLDLLSAQGTPLTKYVSARVESGVRVKNTVPAQVVNSWTLDDLYKSGTENIDGELVYVQHGIFEIRNPYRGTFVNYIEQKQPDNYVTYSGTTYQDTTKPVYGAVLYVSVMPNPADYYLTTTGTGDAAGTTSITVSGLTKEKMRNGDKIILFATNQEEAEGQDKKDEIKMDGPGSGTVVTKNFNSAADSKPHDSFLLAYLNRARYTSDTDYSNMSGKIQVRVVDPTEIVVSSDIKINTEVDPEAEVEVTRLADMLTSLDTVTFTVLGPATDGVPAVHEYPLSGAMLDSYTSHGTTPARATVNKLDGTVYKPHDNDMDDAALGDVYQIIIPIPLNNDQESAEDGIYGKLLAGDTETNLEPDNTLEKFDNPEESRKVQIIASVRKKIELYGDNLSVEVIENNPLAVGQKDILVISGDESGTLEEALVDASQVILTLETPEPERKIISHAYGSLGGISDIQVRRNATKGVDYIIQFPQTVRDADAETELDLYVTTIGSASQSLYKGLKVEKQEKFALFEVKQPAPNTVLIAKGDLPDEYGDADIIGYLKKDPTVAGPKKVYGYNKGEPEDPDTIEKDVIYTEDLLNGPYSLADYWTRSGEYESEDGSGATLIFKDVEWETLEGNNRNTKVDNAEKLPIVIVDEKVKPAEISQIVKVVEKKYDDEENPKLSDIVGADVEDTKVVNNPFPQDDVITVHDSTDYAGKNITVDVYVPQLSDNSLRHIGSANLGTTNGALPITLDAGLNKNSVLDTLGGELYYTVKTDKVAPSDPKDGKRVYGVEPYVLWETSTISPDNLTVKLSEVQDAGAVKFEKIESRLPSTIQGTAVHLTQDSEGNYVVANNPLYSTEDVPDQITVYPEVEKWLEEDGVNDADDETFAGATGDPDEDVYPLKAQYNPTAFLAGESGEEGSKVPNNQVMVKNYDSKDATALIVSSIDGFPSIQPEGYNITGDVKVTVDANAKLVTAKPDPEATVTVKSNNNTSDRSDYTITVDISEATNRGTQDDQFDPATVNLILKYPTITTDEDGNEVHGFNWIALYQPFNGGDTVEISKAKYGQSEANKDEMGQAQDRTQVDPSLQPPIKFDDFFRGLDYTLNGQVEVFFQMANKNKSEGITADYVKAADSEILENTLVTTLNLSTGMILNKADLLSFVTGITEAVPKLASGNTVAAVALDGEWDLYTTTLSADGEEVTGFGSTPVSVNLSEEDEESFNDGWQKALSEMPTSGGYALVSHFKEPDLTNAKITNDNKVAFVQIKLYNDTDDPDDPNGHANPLWLTDGNSDVWKSLKPDADESVTTADKNAAQTFLTRQHAEYGSASNDEKAAIVAGYRTDLVFYYRINGYSKADTLEKTDNVYVERYVNPLINDDGDSLEKEDYSRFFQKIGDQAFADWIKEHEDAKFEVTEIVIDDDGYGSEDAQLRDGHIQPNSGTSTGSYYNASLATNSTIRGTEYYQIRYKVTAGNEVYVAVRSVKLRYKMGDVNLDGSVTGADSTATLAVVRETSIPFKDGAGRVISTLAADMMDLNMDRSVTGADSTALLGVVRETQTIPAMRF